MFDDLEEEGVDVTPDSPDRAVAWAIWARHDGGMTPDEGWAILHERYPADLRFLLLSAYTELSETRKHSEGRIKAARAGDGSGPPSGRIEVGTWSHAYLMKKLETLSEAPEDLLPAVRDLVVFGSALLAIVTGDDGQRLTSLKSKIGIDKDAELKRDDRDRAGIRLRRLEREVLKELDERTLENRSLGTWASAAPPAPTGNEWESAVADPARPRRKYVATERFARGELVEHPKFGVGVVTGTEPGKAVILFESGVRKLVAG